MAADAVHGAVATRRAAQVPPPSAAAGSLAKRVALRFCVVYFTLYSLATQIVGGVILLPGFSFPNLGTRWPMRAITEWTAAHLFGIETPLVFAGNSGDTLFHWIQTSWLLIVSAIAAIFWSTLDRGQRQDGDIDKWFRLFVRFALAGQMFYFGMAKVIPTQFPPPSLVTLVEPVAHLSRTDLLWTFIGASTGYQIFTGAAEVAAGLLLTIPQTVVLGALVASADMAQVFALNMAYDVGLKQISFHLLLLSLFLLIPAMARIARGFVADRSEKAIDNPRLFTSARANHAAWAAQVAFGCYLLVMFARLASTFWHAPGGPGSPRSPLYGIWDVEQLSVDGEVRPAVLNDYDRRWRRIIFDAPDTLVLQRTDDSLAHYGAAIDVRAASIELRKGNSRIWKAVLTFRRSGEDRMVLDGTIDGHLMHTELRRVELDTFRLLGGGFRWIRPPDPYGG